MKIDRLYASRFSSEDREFKQRVWAILWRRVFSRYIRPDDVLLDVGGGYCELVNLATARRRIVVDLNPDAPALAAPGVEVLTRSADDLAPLADGSVSVAFTSNFLEHLPSREILVRVVAEIRRVLAPGGLLVAMGPNIRFMPDTYWDFLDHHLPLSDRSVCELLVNAGLSVERVVPRFVPETTKLPLPRWSWLVEAYLSLLPLSSRVFGRQFLIVARNGPAAPSARPAP